MSSFVYLVNWKDQQSGVRERQSLVLKLNKIGFIDDVNRDRVDKQQIIGGQTVRAVWT